MNFLILVVLFASQSAQAQAPKFSDLLLCGQEICCKTQWEAEALCKERGMRLPTARDFALLSQASGAVGISTSNESEDFKLVDGVNSSNGQADEFYYNHKGTSIEGYAGWNKCSSGYRLLSLWTSTRRSRFADPRNAWYYNGGGYRPGEKGGELINTVTLNTLMAVRCVP